MKPLRRLRKLLLRLRQWRALIKLAGSNAKWLPMLKALQTGGVDAATYRARLRTCARCPIYDRNLKACRREVFGQNHSSFEQAGTYAPVMLGCGCYVPFLAKTRAPYQRHNTYGVVVVRGCWGRATYGAPFGWGEP